MSGPLQALAARYDRLAATGEVAAFGLSWERISYAVVLDGAGGVVDVQPLMDTDGKKPQPRAMLVPGAVKRTSRIASNFLWDKTSYTLGVSAKPGKRVADERVAFEKLQRDLIGSDDDQGLRALLAFLAGWKPERFEAAHFRPEMLDANLVFAFDGDEGFLHERPAARAVWQAHLASASTRPRGCA